MTLLLNILRQIAAEIREWRYHRARARVAALGAIILEPRYDDSDELASVDIVSEYEFSDVVLVVHQVTTQWIEGEEYALNQARMILGDDITDDMGGTP